MATKRKKNDKCPNPMFLYWLEEWKKEAEERSLNSKWTYAKAIASIKKYPLPLRSGKEAKILENIGDGIAKKLDERLTEYLENGGDYSCLHQVPIVSSVAQPKKKKRIIEEISAAPADVDVMSEFCDVAGTSTKRSRMQAYIPKYRSGAYALLTALYNETLLPSYPGYMTKEQLQEKAQHLCDKSFITPDAGSHYTAWSSMRTLIAKGCVVKKSSPAKYYLTEYGCKLATTLIKGEHSLTSSQPISLIDEADEKLLDDVDTDVIKSSEATLCSPPLTFRNNNGECRFGGTPQNLMVPGGLFARLQDRLSNKNKEQKPVCCDVIDVDANHTTEFYERPQRLQDKLSNKNKEQKPVCCDVIDVDANHTSEFYERPQRLQDKLSNKNKEQKPVCCDVIDADANHTTAFYERPQTALPPITNTPLRYWYVTESGEESILKSKALVSIDDDIGFAFLIKSSLAGLKASTALYKVNETRTPSNGFHYVWIADKCCKDVASPPTVIDKPTSIPQNCHSQKPIIEENVASVLSNCTSHSTIHLKDTGLAKKVYPPTKDIEPIFTLLPGSFNIVLCVDNTETLGSGKGKKVMAEKLSKSGIMFDTRKLQLGDFLWIAKEKFGSQRELVVDVIIERKRMDDLASSICDGRFREQKYRLKNSGLLKLIYLIESYGSAKHLPVAETTLQQAIMNAQTAKKKHIFIHLFTQQTYCVSTDQAVMIGHSKHQDRSYFEAWAATYPFTLTEDGLTILKVIDGFLVKETEDVHDSAKFLEIMTRSLIKMYKDKQLFAVGASTVKRIKEGFTFDEVVTRNQQHLMAFDEFSTQSHKNKVLTAREMFAKQLMQIKGVSADRALAIVEVYPTPLRFVRELEKRQSVEDKENIVANIKYGKSKRKVGVALSKQLYTLYTHG